jgi:uncharacterized protein
MADPASPPPEVADAVELERFEARIGGELAGFLAYHRRPGQLSLVHTEVDEAFEGRGIGGALVRAAVDQARAQDLAILPFCPFAREWLARHPEHVDLVPAGRREAFGLPSAD